LSAGNASRRATNSARQVSAFSYFSFVVICSTSSFPAYIIFSYQ
jgi:hypothetical protein